MDDLTIVNPIYHKNTIHISDAKAITEPQHFACAIEEGEIELISSDVKNSKLTDCLRSLLCIFCLLIACFSFFILLGGAILFF